MSKPIQTVEELDAVLHWRGKHAQAIRERDALQQMLNQRDEQVEALKLQRHDVAAACAHEWTDDGEHLLVCTVCGAQEDHTPGWCDMATAPTDGTMVRLLVEFEEHSTEDAEQAPTIGANNFDNDGEDVWRFAGWCWSHDHFTEGKGVPVGWLPMLDGAKLRPGVEQPLAVAVVMPDRLAQILKFLEGAENLDGYWFGEPGPHGSKVWWRAELRKALTETNIFEKQQ